MKTSTLLVLVVACAAMARDSDEFSTAAGKVRITPVRHASLMIEAGGKVIHVDPWSQGNYDGLPAADLILITDIHADHLDPKAIEKVSKPGTEILAAAAAAEKVAQAKAIRNGETGTWGDWKIEAVPAYNLTRGPAPGKVFHEKGRGNGYVLTYGGMRIYLSGDSEGIPEMRALRNIDVAFVCMNVPYTMTPEEAAEAVKAFHPKVVYPYHYRGSDLKLFENALAGTGIETRTRNWY